MFGCLTILLFCFFVWLVGWFGWVLVLFCFLIKKMQTITELQPTLRRQSCCPVDRAQDMRLSLSSHLS